MTYLLIGALLFVLLYGATARRALARLAPMKVAAAGFAVMALAASGFVLLRGGWIEALMLLALGAGLSAWARWPRAGRAAPSSGMSASEARATLGVSSDASADDIKAAYARLIQRVHPDRGGAAGLAAHLNLARDVLLKM